MCKITKENRCCLKIEDVTYCYDGERLPVWQHLSCCFSEGKIHAISGPSGCGKSSILYLLDGLIPHMYEGELKGKIYLNEEDITDVMPRYRCDKIGFVMQNPESQFTTFTVEEELAFGMENLCTPVPEMEERIKEALKFVGMEGYEKIDLNQLSGGQKQKIAIASLIVTKPKVLLLDEPTANLDSESRKQIFQLIIRLAHEQKMTIILVEHNIVEIMDDVDWMMVLNENGEIVLQGDMQEHKDQFHKLIQHEEGINSAIEHATNESVLDIEHLEFTYPIPGQRRNAKKTGKKIINDLSMHVKSQEFLAIVGENGVGKTTLMRLIFRICKQDAGTIKLYGKPIESYHKRELYHQIGLVFQNPENQFITNTVWEELMFSLKRIKISQQEKEERVNKMLEKFHLEEHKEKSPFVLSQGQKRRLSVASMLLTNQKILFLDEPTYGQDFENRQELMKDMQKLVEEGITIVMITHDLALVKQYATCVAEIEKGKVIKYLPTKEYFQVRD